MDYILVGLVVGLAVLYVGYTFYRQLTGKAGCSDGCSCSPQMKQMCESGHNSMDNLTFK